MWKGSVLLFRTQCSQLHPQHWPWGLTWYCNLSPAPNTSSSPKINIFPKVQESLKPQLLFLPQAITVLLPTKLWYKMIQWYKNISESEQTSPKAPPTHAGAWEHYQKWSSWFPGFRLWSAAIQQESFWWNLNIQAQNRAKELYKTAGARTLAGSVDG